MSAIHTDHCLVCPFVPPQGYGVYQVCEICRGKIRADLADIPHLYERLGEAMMPGATKGPKITGSKEKPILGGAALILRGPAANHNEVSSNLHLRHSEPIPRRDDQVDTVPIIGVLDTWERDWREKLGHNVPTFRGTIEQTIKESIRYFTRYLDLACDEHPAIDEFVDELRHLRNRCRAVLGEFDKPEHKSDVPCPRCDQRALYRPNGSDSVHCGACGHTGTEEDYQRWTGLLAGYARQRAG